MQFPKEYIMHYKTQDNIYLQNINLNEDAY